MITATPQQTVTTKVHTSSPFALGQQLIASDHQQTDPAISHLAAARRQMEEAHHRLNRSGYAALSQLSCQCNDGVLVLQGRLPSYYLKQLAQTLVRDIDGATIIVNKVKVD